MSEQQRAARGAPDHVSGAEVRATQKVAAAQQAINRTFPGTLMKLALAGGAAYTLYYMWNKSETPLPQPASEALSKVVSAAGAKEQQILEQAMGTYPGAANDATSAARQQQKH